MAVFSLKATSEDHANAIIQSFSSKWQHLLLSNVVRVVFRKQGPKTFRPNLLYAYLSAPVSAIVGKADVLQYEFLPTEQALDMASQGSIDVRELRAYAGEYAQLLVMRIGNVLHNITNYSRAHDEGVWLSAIRNFHPAFPCRSHDS